MLCQNCEWTCKKSDRISISEKIEKKVIKILTRTCDVIYI